MTEQGEFAAAAVRSTAWQGLAFLFGRVATLAATVLLARLLTPGEFGLAMLALVFIVFAETISTLGAAEAIVYRGSDRRTVDAAFTVSLGWGLLLAVTALALAPHIAAFFGRPEVADLLRVLVGGLFLTSLGQVPDALLRRRLAFRKRMYAESARALAQGAVALVLAAAGAGAWALVWGYVASSLLWSAVCWILARYRPARDFWRLDRGRSLPILAFGVPVTGQALLSALIYDIDYVIVGRLLGPDPLGAYTLAFRIPQVLILSVFIVLSTVAFPMFSLVRDDAERLRRGYLTTVRLQSVYGVAVGVGLLILAPLLVPVLLGDQWRAAVVPLQGLAAYATFRSLGSGAVDVYKGIGRPGIAVTVSLIRLLFLVPILLLAARAGGINAVAWAQAAAALPFAILMQTVACRIIGVPVRELVTAIRPAVAAAVGVAVGAAAVRFGIPAPDLIRLTLSMMGAAATGLAAVWIVDRTFVDDTISLIRPALSRSAA